MTFVESYKLNLDKIHLISKVSAFLIGMLIFLEISNDIKLLYFFVNEESSEINDYLNSIIKGFVVQFLVLLTFGFRFVWLLLSQRNIFVTERLSWIFCWITIFLYFKTYVFFESQVTPKLLILYLFISPIKQLATLLYSYFYRK